MILLDTSVLVDAFTGAHATAPAIRSAIARGERLATCTLALFEWLRGPRDAAEIALQESVVPRLSAISFGPTEAAVAADLYRRVRNARAREVDLAIAASAITAQATVWTLNVRDFADIPGLDVSRPV